MALLSILGLPVRAGASGPGEQLLPEIPAALASSPSPAPESLIPPAEAEGRIIAGLELDSRGKIHPGALLRQLRLRSGEVFRAEIWERDVQNVRNLGYFRSLETQVFLQPDGRVLLRLSADPSWSILPILGYQGGAQRVAVLGLYDANLLAEMVELGGYYMKRDRHHLLRGWLQLPNVLHHGTKLELQLVMTGTTLALYPGDPAALPPEVPLAAYDPDELRWRLPGQGYEVLRRGLLLELGGSPGPDWLRASLRYLALWEARHELPNLPLVLDREQRGLDPPPLERGPVERSRLSLLALNLQLGQVDLVDNYHFRGHELRAIAVP